MTDFAEVLSKLEDAESCATLGINAYAAERYDHMEHYLKVIKKHLVFVNEAFNEEDSESVTASGCNVTKLPSLDDYDQNRRG